MTDRILQLVELIKQPQCRIVLTGEFQSCDRLTATDIFGAMNFLMAGSVSSKTSFVLVGAGYRQNKIDRAISLGIPVFSEDEFWAAVAVAFPSDE